MINYDIVGDWRIRINGMEHGVPHVHDLSAMEAVCRLRSRRAKMLAGGVQPHEAAGRRAGGKIRANKGEVPGRIPEAQSMTRPRIETACVTGDLKLEIAGARAKPCPSTCRSRPAALDALRTPGLLRTHDTRDEWGHRLDWSGRAGSGTDRLYANCPPAGWPADGQRVQRLMQRNGLSLASAAESLGATRRMIAHHRTGSQPDSEGGRVGLPPGGNRVGGSGRRIAALPGVARFRDCPTPHPPETPRPHARTQSSRAASAG